MTDRVRDVEDLAAATEGTVIETDDGGYDEARSVWNATIDRTPGVIVQPVDPADVAEAIRFARERSLPVAVQGGGHNVAGHGTCDDGVLIDFSVMTAVEVDPEARTARVEPGATVRDLDAATTVHGLATPAGIVSTTGVAGLTLGGGWGWLSRSLGLAIDNLRSVELVTADGELVYATADEHPDLFWAVRGGGGNFGVVVAFEFELHPIPPRVLCGVLAFPFDAAKALFAFHREFTAEAPAELCCYASVRTAPNASFVPASLRGEKIATAYLCFNGEVTAGERAIEPLREFGYPLLDTVEARPYAEYQQAFDDVYPAGARNYWKSGFVEPAGLTDVAIETILEHATTVTSSATSIVIEHLGGEITRRDADATAFAHRDSGYAFNVFTRWDDAGTDARHVEWTRVFFDAMREHLADGVYVNFLGRDRDRVPAAFGGNYDRLRDVKSRYDPENVFRVNQNVEPR